MLTGSDFLEEATSVAKDVSEILKQGHSELRKFYSNDREALKSNVVPHNRPSEMLNLQLWWHGPQWLSENSSNWPTVVTAESSNLELPDIRKGTHVFVSRQTETFPIKDSKD
ncbi:hypothetical protein ILUMI_15953 [Ignelater luminosus]|uniref:Uncharacterized protein n=1 Tax=Ignelater luminosus TaxID=2038154 RepID=A0A8K0G3C8_IGNLU|nr:hypothetical protein ILUMI_15953 [Ignelater luminosus]